MRIMKGGSASEPHLLARIVRIMRLVVSPTNVLLRLLVVLHGG